MRLDDSLIRMLSESKAPHAYSHEVRYMAQEILERRADESARAATIPQNQHGTGVTSSNPGQPFPRGVYP